MIPEQLLQIFLYFEYISVKCLVVFYFDECIIITAVGAFFTFFKKLERIYIDSEWLQLKTECEKEHIFWNSQKGRSKFPGRDTRLSNPIILFSKN